MCDTHQISEELALLFKARDHIETQISYIKEQDNFNDLINTDIKNSLTPFINNFFNEYKEQFYNINFKNQLKLLEKMILEIKQLIKSLCNHQFEDDTIDCDCENSMNITYCTICYSTF